MTSVLHVEGVASLALLPSGGISGHVIDAATKKCYGVQGTEIKCERECSRGEDYRLVELTVIDFDSNRECTVVAEQRGADAARIRTAEDAHGWEEEIVEAAREGHSGPSPELTFDCKTLKADADAQSHIQRFLPALNGQDAVINVGKMVINGLRFTEMRQGKKRGHEKQSTCESDCQPTPSVDKSEPLGKRWRLVKGSNGDGWFTRREVSSREAEAAVKFLRTHEFEEAGPHDSQQEDRREETCLPNKKGLDRAVSPETPEQSAAGTLEAQLRSVQRAVGLLAESIPRPTPVSRQVLETDKDDWL